MQDLVAHRDLCPFVREILDVSVEGLEKPIGTTAPHRFWSEDRQEFVPAGELRVGARLRASDGRLRAVVSVQARGMRLPVYNLEVDGDHVFYVSDLKLLAHNTNPSPWKWVKERGPQRKSKRCRIARCSANIQCTWKRLCSKC